MKNKGIWVEVLVIMLVFGILVAGCDNNINDGEKDPALNGTWMDQDDDKGVTFDNGDFFTLLDGINLHTRGSYTTRGNTITTKVTHIHGGLFESLDLDSRWYTENEFKSIIVPAIITEEIYNMAYAGLFIQATLPYSVSGNTLTWGGVNFTKI